ncbi:glycoside hydrolase [Candidatus Saccharibacteria bacterium]|nr:glycoside hydrolase [Candidatus Saccharibacteria bacterium]
MEREHLIKICREVLSINQNGSHTMPAPDLYPHQWLWDSCFIAIGLRHYDIERAKDEIMSLLEGQWSNGMIPHMIFDPSLNYGTDRDIWRSFMSPYSPDNLSTSGITQPPIIAEAIKKVGSKLNKSDAIKFYKQVLPKLFNHHQWLMSERDPHGEGLTLQIHPWETGLDNNPVWMEQLSEHSKPWWIVAIEKLHLDGIVNVLRRDTRHVAPGQRISNVEALVMFDMIRRFRRKNYDIIKILHRSLFCIEDIGFNSILARNNKILIELAEMARVKIPKELLDMIHRQADALKKSWDKQDGNFYSKDFITGQPLQNLTISSLLPLYSGVISQDQAQRLVDQIKNYKIFGLRHPIPSVPVNNKDFDPMRYWQGPTWVNTNWLIIDGLKQYGFSEIADDIIKKTIELVEYHGPYEYFSPVDGQPLGAANFSWTAALTIDLLSQ